GRAFLCSTNPVSGASQHLLAGFGDTVAYSDRAGVYFDGLMFSIIYKLPPAGQVIAAIGGPNSYAAGTWYDVAVVLGSDNAKYLRRTSGSSQYTLEWVSAATVDDTLRLRVMTPTNPTEVKNLRVVDIPSWSSDAQVYTSYKALPVATNTDSHMADCWLDWTQTTVPSGGTQQIDFRRASETERWYLTLDSAGAITLYEDTGGSDTSRGTWTGVVNGNRIMVLADSTTIKVYVADTLRITYASASTNATATTWYVTGLGTGGAIADLYAWPRYPAFPGGV
ncbi:MAG: hypothetical protein AB1625_13020, partial [Acidobacteriota bacterium]